MAKVEMADLGVIRLDHANLSEAVGLGEKNEKNDVMLIQALFKLVGYGDSYTKKYFGLNFVDLPEPTGSLDEKTIRAIWGFQRTMGHRLLNVDGKIHPASYANRVIKQAHKGGRLMMITLLNLLALDGALFTYSTDLISSIKLAAPQLVLRTAPPPVTP